MTASPLRHSACILLAVRLDRVLADVAFAVEQLGVLGVFSIAAAAQAARRLRAVDPAALLALPARRRTKLLRHLAAVIDGLAAAAQRQSAHCDVVASGGVSIASSVAVVREQSGVLRAIARALIEANPSPAGGRDAAEPATFAARVDRVAELLWQQAA